MLDDLCDTMKFGSLCALGGFTPYPVMSALDHFPEDFGAHARAPAGRGMRTIAMSLIHEDRSTARRLEDPSNARSR